ncbi:MAG: ribonuclease J [Bradymonadaceae bacterium]
MSNGHSVESRPSGDYLRYIPLGGLDEVGMNCALIECNGKMLMVDCGYTFPESESFGVDYIIPDWSYVQDNIDRLEAIVLTHGHQDHIGALPYFLQKADVPVYAGRLTLSMLAGQLAEHGLADGSDLYGVGTDELLEIGPFTVEFIHVNHSVPNAMAIALETPVGTYIVTGDWKLDQTPLYEPVMDLQTFSALGREGVTALFGDSTNAEVPGTSNSEFEVFRNIGAIMEDAPGRVVVSQFSSNMHRIGSLLELAERHHRKVVLMGYSLRKNFEKGQAKGFLSTPDDEDLIIRPHEMKRLPDERVLVVSTGSQAEPRASLTRMSEGDHNDISVRDTDTVIISARMIPGNERGIQTMIDNLARRGANVVLPDEESIHGSGHACQDELKLMMNLTKPDYLVPVHGRYRMRKRHAELAREVGVPERLLIENGDVLQFTHDDADVVGEVQTGRVLVDGRRAGDIEDADVRDRANLAEAGIVAAYVVIDRNTGELASSPELIQRGLLSEDDDEMLQRAVDSSRSAVKNLSKDARRNTGEVEEALRTAIRRFFGNELDRRPVVVPVVREV